jgi:hypothetical protein
MSAYVTCFIHGKACAPGGGEMDSCDSSGALNNDALQVKK